MKRYLIPLILSVSFLSGCMPSAVVAGAAAGTTMVYDQRPLKQIVQDQKITAQAYKKIQTDPSLKAQHIVISTLNKRVLIAGQVESAQLRTRTYSLISNVKNVDKIYNQLLVHATPTLAQATKDAWITTKVKTALLDATGLSSSMIKVLTEQKTVYLMGMVSTQQASQAITIVRQIDGVQKVVNLLQIT